MNQVSSTYWIDEIYFEQVGRRPSATERNAHASDITATRDTVKNAIQATDEWHKQESVFNHLGLSEPNVELYYRVDESGKVDHNIGAQLPVDRSKWGDIVYDVDGVPKDEDGNSLWNAWNAIQQYVQSDPNTPGGVTTTLRYKNEIENNPGRANGWAIRQFYQHNLGRLPSQEEINNWLAQGMPANQINSSLKQIGAQDNTTTTTVTTSPGDGNTQIQPPTAWTSEQNYAWLRGVYKNHIKNGEGVHQADLDNWLKQLPENTDEGRASLFNIIKNQVKLWPGGDHWLTADGSPDSITAARQTFQQVFQDGILTDADWTAWQGAGANLDNFQSLLRKDPAWFDAFRGYTSKDGHITTNPEATFSLTRAERDYADEEKVKDIINVFGPNRETRPGYEDLHGDGVHQYHVVNKAYNDVFGRNISLKNSNGNTITNHLTYWAHQADPNNPEILKGKLRDDPEWHKLAKGELTGRLLPRTEFNHALDKGYLPQDPTGTTDYESKWSQQNLSDTDWFQDKTKEGAVDYFENNDYMLYHYKDAGITSEADVKWLLNNFEAIMGDGTEVAAHFGTTIKKVIPENFAANAKDVDTIKQILGGNIDWAHYRDSNTYATAWKTLQGQEGWDGELGLDAYLGITHADEIRALNKVLTAEQKETIKNEGKKSWTDDTTTTTPKEKDGTFYVGGDVTGEPTMYGIDINVEANKRYYQSTFREDFNDRIRSLDATKAEADIEKWMEDKSYTIGGEGVGWEPPKWKPRKKDAFKAQIDIPDTQIKDPGTLPSAVDTTKAKKIPTLKSKTTGALR